jgi:hypothetical protein
MTYAVIVHVILCTVLLLALTNKQMYTSVVPFVFVAFA